MAAKDAEQSGSAGTTTFLHGFTTVIAMLCDYSEKAESHRPEVSANAIISSDDAWA